MRDRFPQRIELLAFAGHGLAHAGVPLVLLTVALASRVFEDPVACLPEALPKRFGLLTRNRADLLPQRLKLLGFARRDERFTRVRDRFCPLAQLDLFRHVVAFELVALRERG